MEEFVICHNEIGMSAGVAKKNINLMAITGDENSTNICVLHIKMGGALIARLQLPSWLYSVDTPVLDGVQMPRIEPDGCEWIVLITINMQFTSYSQAQLVLSVQC